MLSKLFGTDGIMELLATPSFWYTIVILVGLIVLVVFCLKYPKIGGPVLIVVGYSGLIALTCYSWLQLNIYYSAKGGIHGAITGIFNTNEVQVVDDMSFEFKNIELTEASNNKYSASITINQVVSLDTRESLGVFVNGMPCDTTSEVQADYAIAEYVYSFYDEDKSLICTDVLTLNFSFYDNCTYLSISTDGGTLPVEECIKYWHYYFNKNGFVVTIAPLDSMSSDTVYGSGDTSNYAVVTYVIEDQVVYKQVYKINDTLTLPELTYQHEDWTIGDLVVENGYVVTGDVVIHANAIYNYTVTYTVGEETYFTETVIGGGTGTLENSFEYEPMTETYRVIEYWTLNGERVDVTTNLINSDVEYVAVYHTEYLVKYSIPLGSAPAVRVLENNTIPIPELPETFVLDYYYIYGSSESIELTTYEVTSPVLVIAEGAHYYIVNYIVNGVTIDTQSVEYYTYPSVVSNPEIVGKEFLGWSIDGINPVDPSKTLITSHTDFIAILSDIQFTLSVDNNDGTSAHSVIGTYGATHDLGIPIREGYVFLEWRITSGDGSINGTEYTFGVGDATIVAIWDSCKLYVNSPIGFYITLDNGETHEVNDYLLSSCRVELAGQDYTLGLKSKAKTSSIEIDTDGEYSIAGSHSEGYTITWTGASYMNITIKASNVQAM